MNHTPGPWKWWTSCSWRRLQGDVDGSERWVLFPTVHPTDKHPDITVTDADMRLIEAAPELLEELKNISNAKRFSREHFRDDTEFADWVQSRARFVLAKVVRGS